MRASTTPRIIPAYAGSTLEFPLGFLEEEDHPRIRGEHAGEGIDHRERCGSSPHTRGARTARAVIVHPSRIIPAYAGSTPLACPPYRTRTDHPRIRGEHRMLGDDTPLPGGSSPHTRGALVPEGGDAADRRIIPAYAGSTPTSMPSMTWVQDHPRIRGEHEKARRSPRRRWGSSPHTRGARLRQARPRRAARIIPAYAGSTGGPHTTSNRQWDHPRIRGEHDKDPYSDEALAGSSPHTRGARLSCRCRARRSRIIPAYAGSTGIRAGEGLPG